MAVGVIETAVKRQVVPMKGLSVTTTWGSTKGKVTKENHLKMGIQAQGFPFSSFS
jgi:hypothetical protein